ncbi:MAG: ATP synthase F0 subunit B, partial [Candidatus Sulfotelmatobacter sp.]
MSGTTTSGGSTLKRARFARAIVRGCLLALLLSFAGSVASLRAQEPAAAPKQPAQDSARPHGPGGPGHQLAHETREAAGEEKDEMAEFKESGSVRLIARLTGMDLRHAYWLSLVFNFAVIAGVLVWAGRKFLPGIFRDRTAAIQKAMQEAQKASEEAQRKLADIESRLMRLDAEIGAIRDEAEKEGFAEAERIKRAAEEDARKIVASAEQEIAAAAKAARRQLTAYAADLAVGLAQKQIHVDTATDQALVRGFAGQIDSAPRGPGADNARADGRSDMDDIDKDGR